MVTLDRNEIIATNKSLRTIKNELEQLLEKGVLTDDAFDNISRLLPNETPLSVASPALRNGPSNLPSPAPSNNPQSPPVDGMNNLSIASPTQAPPAYNSLGPPSLPTRKGPPPPPPSKPVISHARALYKYTAADERDLSFERDDQIAVYEYMNDDWWMGRNVRTNAEGIFPKNYVEIDHSMPPPGAMANEKAGYYGSPQPMYAQGYPAPPPQQNPYNSSVPPMAVADQGSGSQEGGHGKAGQMGKKFGKKLGNAAIFGAGATIGSNIVNSIF